MDDLAFETAANERYLAALGGAPVVMNTPVVLPANTQFTGTGSVKAEVKAFGPLAARVGLGGPDEDLGSAFYIGERRISRGKFDAEVVSWAAPVAKVFYDPANCDHEIMGDVVGRRSLLTSNGKVVSVFDDWVEGVCPQPSPFARDQLVVAPAPPPRANASTRRSQLKRPSTTAAPSPEPVPPAVSTPQRPASHPVPARQTARAPKHSPKEAAAAKVRDGMRAAESVDFALSRPRNDALESLLATIQPDQYAMITARPDRPLLLQGHPGTGKSVIAIHRAAYLVNPVHVEPDADNREVWPTSVLFVGPTAEWRHHVSAAVRSLDEQDNVTVIAMPDLLADLAQIKIGAAGDDPTLGDVARIVSAVVGKAAGAARAEGLIPHPKGPVAAVEAVYDVIRKGRTRTAALDLESPDSRAWIRTLPPFQVARQQARYQGLFAAIGRYTFKGRYRRFDHIVVDEAQDVTGVEWSLLRSLNRGENWTLVGDMNQRRNDYVDSSWEGIADRLLLGAVSPRILERGYRSTQPILDFSKRLLPRNERTAVTLQHDGPPVRLERAATLKELGPTAVSQAIRLLDAHPGGTVGIIAARPDPVRDALQRTGWRPEGANGWQFNSRSLTLLTHISSRGVEFDGVVVVEPASFPQNLGRIGPLYTSLTRANRELAVVSHAALPDALRRHNKNR